MNSFVRPWQSVSAHGNLPLIMLTIVHPSDHVSEDMQCLCGIPATSGAMKTGVPTGFPKPKLVFSADKPIQSVTLHTPVMEFIMTFAGLTSRCIIPFLCRQQSPEIMSCVFTKTVSSSSAPLDCKTMSSEHPATNSISRRPPLTSRASNRMTLGCTRCLCANSNSANASVLVHTPTADGRNFFSATCPNLYTTLCAPLPRSMLLLYLALFARLQMFGTSPEGFAGRFRREVSPEGFAGRFRRKVSPEGFAGRFRREVSPEGFAGRFRRKVSPEGFAGRFRRKISPEGFAGRFRRKVSPGGFAGRFRRKVSPEGFAGNRSQKIALPPELLSSP